MLGLLTLGLTCVMIYTLVKNALLGKQLSKDDQFNGKIELIIPVTAKSDFYIGPWHASLSSLQLSQDQLRVHILVDGHHPALNVWEELTKNVPYLEIHSFPMRPAHLEAVPWMLDQISTKISSEVVIIGDPELVPTRHAFLSSARTITDKKRSYFILPQTNRHHLLGEATSVLNPTLAFASFFGVKRWRRNITHPLLSISQGWMCMNLQTFQELSFKTLQTPSWKEAVSTQWDEQGKTYYLAFGEKHLQRFYPEHMKGVVWQLKDRWEDLWGRKNKKGMFFFLLTLLLWAFPFICFLTHPFWSIASLFLLVIYRFFTKIVFQESWRALILHPVGCFIWIGTFVWWLSEGLKSRFGSQARIKH